jgi:hypothetical protein
VYRTRGFGIIEQKIGDDLGTQKRYHDRRAHYQFTTNQYGKSVTLYDTVGEQLACSDSLDFNLGLSSRSFSYSFFLFFFLFYTRLEREQLLLTFLSSFSFKFLPPLPSLLPLSSPLF